jgi:hypothetical protein
MVESLRTQLHDTRLVAVEIIAHDHQRQPRVLLTHPRHEALGRIPFTVLFALPIAAAYFFYIQG